MVCPSDLLVRILFWTELRENFNCARDIFFFLDLFLETLRVSFPGFSQESTRGQVGIFRSFSILLSVNFILFS